MTTGRRRYSSLRDKLTDLSAVIPMWDIQFQSRQVVCFTRLFAINHVDKSLPVRLRVGNQ